MNRRRNTVKTVLWLTLAAVALAALFYVLVRDDWDNAMVETEPLTSAGLIPISDAPDAVILQRITPQADRLTRLSFVPGRIRPDASGILALDLVDETGPILRSLELDASALKYDELNDISLEPALEGLRGKPLLIRLNVGNTGVSFQYGKTVTAGKMEVEAGETGGLSVQGVPMDGMLLVATAGQNRLGLSWLAPVLVLLIYGAVLFLLLRISRSVRTGRDDFFFRLSEVAVRYGFLLKKLISRDFKTKYQASVLGVLWSFLNPLLTMLVYMIVFSFVFRSNIEHFPAYLLTGIVIFNYFSESTSLGLNSIVANRALITKVYMPKIIYPLSRTLSSAVNLLISFVPMFIVMLVTGVPFRQSLLLLPLVVLFLVAFCLGMTLILSTLNVFFRDTQFLWGILLTVWNFLTPIFYPETIIPASFRTLYHLNPLYQIVYFMRCITVGGVSPAPLTYLYCFLAAFIPLTVGIIVFRSNQDRFVIYL